MLPDEILEILGRLRADADPMPPRQLRDVVDAGWGRDWMHRFKSFDVPPFAAESVGQVHRPARRTGANPP